MNQLLEVMLSRKWILLIVVFLVLLSGIKGEISADHTDFTIQKIHYYQQPPLTPHCRKSSNKRLHEKQILQTSASCKANEVEAIATRFSENNHDDSSCPKESWLVAMASADPSSDKIFVNIGVNKGYNLAVWMDAFLPFLEITPKVWHDGLSVDRPNLWVGCGVCTDCNQSFTHPEAEYGLLFDKSRKAHLDVLVADLNCPNLGVVKDALTAIDAKINPKMKDYLSVYSTCAGLSNAAGTLKKPKCLGFDERCSLSFYNPKSTEVVNVPIITLDMLMTRFIQQFFPSDRLNATHGCETTSSKTVMEYFQSASTSKPYRPIVDVMVIDTEGNDKLVLDGASQLISSRSVRAMVFEYHQMNPWPTFKLENVVRRLDSSGYDCFFSGQERLWKLTGESCWNIKYEFHDWSNVFCVLREDMWYLAIQPFIVTSPPPLRGKKQLQAPGQPQQQAPKQQRAGDVKTSPVRPLQTDQDLRKNRFISKAKAQMKRKRVKKNKINDNNDSEE